MYYSKKIQHSTRFFSLNCNKKLKHQHWCIFKAKGFVSVTTFLAHIGPQVNIGQKATELVLLFYKDITKLVFLWPNIGQKIFKVLIIIKYIHKYSTAWTTVPLWLFLFCSFATSPHVQHMDTISKIAGTVEHTMFFFVFFVKLWVGYWHLA